MSILTLRVYYTLRGLNLSFPYQLQEYKYFFDCLSWLSELPSGWKFSMSVCYFNLLDKLLSSGGYRRVLLRTADILILVCWPQINLSQDLVSLHFFLQECRMQFPGLAHSLVDLNALERWMSFHPCAASSSGRGKGSFLDPPPPAASTGDTWQSRDFSEDNRKDKQKDAQAMPDFGQDELYTSHFKTTNETGTMESSCPTLCKWS